MMIDGMLASRLWEKPWLVIGGSNKHQSWGLSRTVETNPFVKQGLPSYESSKIPDDKPTQLMNQKRTVWVCLKMGNAMVAIHRRNTTKKYQILGYPIFEML